MDPSKPDFDRLSRDLVRALRGDRSQLEFSRLLGHRGNVAYRWEAGLRQPTARALFAMIERLGLPSEQALGALHPSAPRLARELGGPTAPAFPTALVRHLAAGRPATALARQVGISAPAVRRVLRGESNPPLSTFLALLRATGPALSGFLETLVPPDALGALGAGYLRSLAQRRMYQAMPWTEAVLAVIETRAYRSQSAHSDAWIARVLGRPVHEVAAVRRSLLASGGLAWKEGQLRTQPERQTWVNDAKSAELLADHWIRESAQVPWGERRSNWLVLSTTDETAAEIEAILRRAWREIRERVAESVAPDRVFVVIRSLAAMDGQPLPPP